MDDSDATTLTWKGVSLEDQRNPAGRVWIACIKSKISLTNENSSDFSVDIILATSSLKNTFEMNNCDFTT